MGWFGGGKSSKKEAGGGTAKNSRDSDDEDEDDIISLDDRALDRHADGAGGATVAVPDASCANGDGPRVSVNRPYYEQDDGVPLASNGNNHGTSTTEVPLPEKKKAGCLARFCSELNPCSSWFAVRDPATGRTLDIPESFAPASCYAFLWKLACAAAAILTLTWSFVEDDSEAYFVMAYFTNWGVAFCIVYFLHSVLNTVLAARTPQPSEGGAAGCRIRSTWFWYALGAHTTACATVFYWPFVFDPETTELTFGAVSGHGGLLVLMLLDGMLVNRIPLRWQHWYAILLIDVAYVGWTLVHAYVLEDVGNPNESDSDPATNDDAIYGGTIEWQNDWQKSLIYSVINCFALSPLLYLILWTLSNGLCWDRRKYVDSVDERDQRPTVADVEEGSIFAKWR